MTTNEESLFECEPYNPVTELCLCEQDHLILKPNKLYRFIVDDNCKECMYLAETGRTE